MDLDTKKYQEKMGQATEAQKSLLDRAEERAGEGETPTLTEDEQKQFNKHDEEYNAANKHVKRIEDQKEKVEKEEERAYQFGQDPDEKQEKDQNYRDALVEYMQKGDQVSEKTMNALKEGPVNRAQAAGTDASGGFLIDDSMADEITFGLKQFGQVREFAQVETTPSGEDIDFPTIDDTSNKGELLSENTATGSQDVTVGNITMKSWIFSSKEVPVSRKLIKNSTLSLVDRLTRIFGERIGRKTNEKYTTGSGTSEPEGYITAATSGKTTASATAFTEDEILDLIHTIDPAFRENPGAALTFSDNTLRDIKKLRDSEGRSLWQPGGALTDRTLPPTVAGFPYFVNQEMADAGSANNKFMAFGDFGRFIIRDVMGVEMLRLEEREAAKFQVVFLAFMMSDSRLIDAGQNPIKYMQHAAS